MHYSSGNHRRNIGRRVCRILERSFYERRILAIAQCYLSKKDCEACPFALRAKVCPVNAHHDTTPKEVSALC